MEMLCTLRSATEAQRQALLKAPERLQDFLDDEEDFGAAEGASFLELDIGETWHGLQYLLTWTSWYAVARTWATSPRMKGRLASSSPPR
jgi:Domain of unknown function (DUF1877)